MSAQKSKNLQKEVLRQIKTAERSAGRLEQTMKAIIRRTRDYDLERLLKKVDADMMDVQHKLSSARRLVETEIKKTPSRRKQ